MTAELDEQMGDLPTAPAQGAQAGAQELDLSACGYAQADAAIRQNVEVLGYGE